MTIALACCTAATLVAASGCSQTGEAESPAPAGIAARGQQAFSGMCAECHGLEAQGIPSMGMDLRTSDFVQRASTAQLIRFIRTGHRPTNRFPGGMPEDGGDPSLSDQQLADIAAWLKSLGGSAATGSESRDQSGSHATPAP